MCNDRRSHSNWPFAIAFGLTTVVAFPTWATLSIIGLAGSDRVVATALILAAVGTGLTAYIRWCLTRGCIDEANGAARAAGGRRRDTESTNG